MDDIPAPVRLLKAWGAPEDLTDEAVRDCFRRCAPLLPQVVAEVTRLWGGEAPDMEVFEESPGPPPTLRSSATMACANAGSRSWESPTICTRKPTKLPKDLGHWQ